MDHLPKNLKTSLGDLRKICAEHGEYTSTGVSYMLSTRAREIWTPCPDCEEARIAAERQAAAEKVAAEARAKWEALIEEAAIPRRFVGRTFETYRAETDEQKRALQIVKSYADTFDQKALKRGDSLVMLGAPGTGKSHLASSILQAIMPAHCGLYTTCSTIIRAVRSTWRKDSEQTEGQMLAMFVKTPLLVIDEIGVQYGTDSEQSILFEVIDRRYRDMMPTILIGNLKLKSEGKDDKPGLREVLGERIYDRMTETARVLLFTGDSYRSQARKDFAE